MDFVSLSLHTYVCGEEIFFLPCFYGCRQLCFSSFIFGMMICLNKNQNNNMVSVEDDLIFMRTRMSVCFPIFTLLTLFFSFLSRRSLRLWNSLWFGYHLILVPITCVRSNQVEMKSCCGFCVFKSIYLCMWRRDFFLPCFYGCWQLCFSSFLFGMMICLIWPALY